MFGLENYLIQTFCIVGKFSHNTSDEGHSYAVFLTMISAFWWKALVRLVFYHIMLLYSVTKLYCFRYSIKLDNTIRGENFNFKWSDSHPSH